jgi:RNA polymerase sigma-70 factor (ECF subfamily)
MLRYQAGDNDCFETLYHKYKRPLSDFIYRMVMNIPDTENLYQETFFRVIRSKKQYKVTAQFKTWLYQIAVNLCRDRLRKMKRHPLLSWSAPKNPHNTGGVELQDLVSDPKNDVVISLEQEEMVSKIKRAVVSLSEKEHLVFAMKEYQEMKFSEIAEILECPLGTVLSLNHGAQKKLQKALLNHERD